MTAAAGTVPESVAMRRCCLASPAPGSAYGSAVPAVCSSVASAAARVYADASSPNRSPVRLRPACSELSSLAGNPKVLGLSAAWLC